MRPWKPKFTRNFSPFGTVYVKIKRDDRDMPFGFLQYTVSCIQPTKPSSLYAMSNPHP
jgi:hypothetical protein